MHGAIKKIKNKLVAVLTLSLVVQSFAFVVPLTADAATQNAYRWRNDDGSESTATYAAAQNTPLTGVTRNDTKRLRFGVDANSADAALLRQAALALDSGEDNALVGVIDAANGYAYFGTDTVPGRVVKVALGSGTNAPTRVGAVTLNSGENNLLAATIDTTNGYAYFGTTTSPSRIVKVALGSGSNPPTRTGAVTLNTGENNMRAAAIDVANGYAYFGTDWSPGRVVKVALGSGSNPPTRTGAVTLNAGEDYLSTGLIDTTNGYAYFGVYGFPSRVVKVALGSGSNPPTRTGAVAMTSGEDGFRSAVIDAANGYAYFGTNTTPGRVVKVALGSGSNPPTRTAAVTLDTGENALTGAAVDTANGVAYFATSTSPSRLVKVALGSGSSAPTRTTAVTLDSGENNVYPTLIDTANDFVYVGTYTSTAKVVKVSLVASRSYRLEYGEKISTCAAIGSWTQVAASPTTEHWGMSASANITDGAVTTNSAGVTNGGSTFVAGAIHDATSQTAAVRMTDASFTEVEYAITATDDAVDGNYCFRLTDAGTATDFTYSNYAEATVYEPTNDPTLNNVVTPSRLVAGASSTYNFSFDLQNPITGTLTITFPAGFTVTAAATAGSCVGGTVGTFGFTAQTLTAVKTGCSAGTLTLTGSTVTNPGTPGLYTISWVNDDPGSSVVYIIDSDQVTVSANVDPSLTFNVGVQDDATACDGTFSGAGGSLPLGVLTTGAVTSSDVSSVDHICTRISTNSSSGAIVTVRNLNGPNGLVSASVPADDIDSSSATAVAGTENYGVCVGSGGGDTGNDAIAGSASPVRTSPFNGTCATGSHVIGGLTTTAQSLWSLASPSQNAFARVYVKAAISPVTAAHADYADTLTFIATGTF